MFRRAIVTDEVSQDPEVAIRLALRFHLDGLEIRSLWNKGPHELTPIEIVTLRTMIRDAGLAVCAVATPCFKCSLDDPAEVRGHLDILRRCQELCAELETPIARIFTFWRPEDVPPASALAEGGYETRLAPWSKMAPEAEQQILDAAAALLRELKTA